MSTFLTAEWRKLIMAQYEVAPEVLAPFLPPGVELDLYRGADGRDHCFVSLVGFLFTRVRVKRIAIPFHTHFEEVNLRFYVKRRVLDAAGRETEVRRGVVFISEIVPLPAITHTARALYGEAYSTAATRHLWRSSGGPHAGLDISYSWKVPAKIPAKIDPAHQSRTLRRAQASPRGRWQHLSVLAGAIPQDIAPGSMEEFITEHYWGYTCGSGLLRPSGTGEYGVAHPRWQVYPVRSAEVAADFGALYGQAFAHLTDRAPDHVLLAEGSPIAIRMGSHIPA
jgi:hypothetical protein